MGAERAYQTPGVVVYSDKSPFDAGLKETKKKIKRARKVVRTINTKANTEPVVNGRQQIPRNSLCYCGSGKKFKRCCLKGVE